MQEREDAKGQGDVSDSVGHKQPLVMISLNSSDEPKKTVVTPDLVLIVWCVVDWLCTMQSHSI